MSNSTTTVAGAFLSLDDAAQYLSVNPRTIRRRIADGSLTAYRLSGTRGLRIKRADLDAALVRVPSGAYDGGAS